MEFKSGLKRTELSLQDSIGVFILPGDEFLFPTTSSQDNVKIIIGPGLKFIPGKIRKGNELEIDGLSKNRIIACKAGILSRVNAKSHTYFIELKTKHFESYKNDDVLGIIKQKGKGDQYACDVATKERAQLSKSAFEGATKRFRPDLLVGDVVYGKVVDLPKDFPMEITCVHSSGKALGLGSLEDGGNIFHIPVHFTRVLRSPSENDNLLKKIGKIVPCETAVGVNGLVWVKAKSSVVTILVSQLIQKLAKAKAEEYESLLKQFRKGINSLAM